MPKVVPTKPSVSSTSPTNGANKAKAVKLLSKYLKETSICDEIGEALSTEHESNADEFNSHLRNILGSFRGNSSLVKQLELREVTAEKLIGMSTDELANEEIRKMKLKILKDEEDKKRGINPDDIPDHAEFKCRKCGSKKITENLAQTRSADEPMTRFLTCNVCGFWWKLSC